ncbi:MAG: hypothetical protein A2074_07510 [Candidatus Aquicultor primus]|uniref:Uncharacterized protein n=1 Tax=Candidatus Aquicultor primus TaxID=1797195 RepID=A0A1F2UQ50_9ACTN|nr:MAG: hypothetical protein A2074_07510 [Candidatus Aquicultor primus]
MRDGKVFGFSRDRAYFYLLQPRDVHWLALIAAKRFWSFSKWQCLYFLSLPHQHFSFLPSSCSGGWLLPNKFLNKLMST